MIRYNWLFDQWSSDNTVRYFKWLADNGPKNMISASSWNAKMFLKQVVYTPAFIQNLDDLLYGNSNALDYEIYNYIKLCSYRSYVKYLETRDSRLEIGLLNDKLELNKLKNNRLLTVTKTHLIFKFE